VNDARAPTSSGRKYSRLAGPRIPTPDKKRENATMDTIYDQIAEQDKNQKLPNVYDSQSDEYRRAFGVFLAHTD
jgi:hypothetical protein